MKMVQLCCFIILVGLYNVASACDQVYLKKNIDRGRILLMSDGKLYKVLAGDNFDAMLWLPMSSISICGPRNFDYKGTQIGLYDIVNLDDGQKVSAMPMK